MKDHRGRGDSKRRGARNYPEFAVEDEQAVDAVDSQSVCY